MTDYTLKPVALTKENFAGYGDVIEIEHHRDIRDINYGMTKRYHNLANLDLLSNSGQPLFNIFNSSPVALPFKVNGIERHPLSSQLFYPLSNQPFLVLVAGPDTLPSPNDLKLFITNGSQGINYHKNIWHHYLLTLHQIANFIVVDRGGPEKNCDEFFFDDDIVIERV